MTSFLNLERYTEPPAPEVAKAPRMAEEFADYEIVLGRGQIASTGLVAIVLVAVFSGVSYLIGKSTALTAVAATSTPAVPAPLSHVSPPQTQAPTPGPTPALPTAAPLFEEAVTGKVYLQVGAIEKGLAAIWAEGLRTHGLDAFVAPGPSDKEWRVLIGPIPDPQAFQRAKDALDNLGVFTFGRRYPPQ
jgi:cell division septation protein DedD